MRFGDIVKFKDDGRGPELSRYMYIAPSEALGRVDVVCLFVGHPGDDWEVDGIPWPCHAGDMEVVQ